MTDDRTPIPRRSFMSRLLTAWSGVLLLPGLYVVVRYIIPPRLKERIQESLRAGNVAEIPVNDVKIVRFGKTPVMCVKTSEGQIKAFSAVCTHLGCIVEFRTDDRKFHCNCHGSVFDYNGKNLSGPAPRPLQPFRVEIKGEDLYISNI